MYWCRSFLFPLLTGVKAWFLLRLLVGVGDSAINYAAQLWVLLMTPAAHRGRNLSLYGMSYGLGFSLGPLGISLLRFGQAAPFAAIALLFLLVLLLVLVKLPDSRPDKVEHDEGQARRFARSYSLAWYALIPALLYGYMEASLNSNFPVYGLRIGFSANEIAALLPFAGIGGLLLQFGWGGGVFLLMGILYILFGLAGLLFSPRQTI